MQVRTGWDEHWRTDRYGKDHPFLTPEAADLLIGRGAASNRLLKKHGFLETGRAEQTWLIGGEWYDSVYWRLTL